MNAVVGVDPGRAKAGYALVEGDGSVLLAGIEPLERLRARLFEVRAASDFQAIALGRGTNARAVLPMLEDLGLPVHLVDERETTRYARRLYFEDHPPKGWRRFLPVGLQLPARPIDDYAAILIARRFLARGAEAGPPS
ncbi:MAG: pre-16S rRNA-processing nuclease YqgF [Candidatus Eremiobacteraeota bacterium]|nr:pre-16S rRNA-processing nuclease YqgF [Candidatus Eremiobacteraeota bacterium]MBV9264431.1 pre-16S rRNA-processing nuclease YqgF [Candidatus Eremiobacteraeota bacterium]